MSINYYVGISAPCIEVESAQELYDALDLLHTQVMDNLNEHPALLKILSEAMDKAQDIIDQEAENEANNP